MNKHSFPSPATGKILLAIVLSILFNLSVHAQAYPKSLAANKKSAYLMVYHKDADHGLHMAYSYDGRVWTAVNNDRPVMAGDTIAEQKGIRDPYIFRGPDGSVYVAMTDLHVFGERDGVRTTRWERPDEYGWGNNRGLVLMKSSDLIHWNRTNLDFTKIVGGDSLMLDWKDVGCVWAPEMNWDDQRQQIMMHFTTRYKNGRNVIYYTYMNDDFTLMTEQPKLLFAAQDEEGHITAPTIDSDITRIGDTYHLLMVQFGYVKHATSQHLTGPYLQDNLYNDGETQRHEAPCAFRLNGTERYVVMFDNYSREPHNFGFVETTDFRQFTPIGYFDEEGSPMKRTNFSEQKHAGVIAVSKKELRRLIKYWERLSKASDEGYDKAQALLVSYYYMGFYGVEQDIDKAAELYYKAKDDKALTLIAAQFELEQDYDCAVDCYTKAANFGNKNSMTWLANYYIGKGNNPELAEYWKKKAEEK